MMKTHSIYPLLSTTALAALMICGGMSRSYALPEGGIIRGGSASITSSTGRLDVHQGSDKAIIDWRGFDIGAGEKTEFHQPSSSSVTINRVNSTSSSQIDGSLKANGNVVIINQNGIAFGKGAKVDVNSLIVTTADASNEKLMRERKLTFDIPGNPDAVIANEGQISAKEAGLVGLVAPNVINTGTITAKLGRVQLASGDIATVDLYGDGLMKIAVSDKVKSQLVANTGEIKADGGTIALTAAAGAKVVNSLIDAEGHLQAQSVAQKNGEIIISAEGSNAVAGNSATDKGKKTGASTVLVKGILDASGRKSGEHGGKVSVFGDNIALLGGTVIDVSGDSGNSNTTARGKISDERKGAAGGDVKIGGDYLGGGTSPTAKNLYVDKAVYVVNDSLTKGDAGRSIFWSDGHTRFNGNVFARALGGQPIDSKTGDATSPKTKKPTIIKGNGGFVETSGHEQLDAGGYVNLTASNGERGTYFLDPTNITIYGNVDPAFQSTDGSINLASNLKLWLDASDTSKVNLTYSTDGIGTTASGIAGSNTITTTANVSSSLAVGARIRLGGAGAITAASTLGADTYTIAAIAGTTITLSSPLTTNYNGGAGNDTLYRGLVSQITDKSGLGNHAAQGTAANMPLWVSNGQNGLGVTRFDGSNDYLSSNMGTNILNDRTIFVTNNQLITAMNNGIFSLKSAIYGDWYSSDGMTISQRNSGGNTINLISGVPYYGSNPGSNYVDIQTNFGTGAYIASIIYSSTTANLYQNGFLKGTDTHDTSFAANTAGYVLSARADPGGGNNPGLYGNNQTSEIIAYNSALSPSVHGLVEQYQSAKWGIGLTPPGSGATEAAQATASIQKGDAADGYSVFTTRYLERLSQSANISLQASNNINLDLKGDTLALQSGRDLTLTAGNDILSASAGTISTAGTGSIYLNATNDIQFDHNVNFTPTGTGEARFRADRSIGFFSNGGITTQGGAITINSDRDGNGAGGILLNNGGTLTSNGGAITLGGGNNPLTGFAKGLAGVVGGVTRARGIHISSANVISSGGAITIHGEGLAATDNGIEMYSSSMTSGNAPILLRTNASNIQMQNNSTISSTAAGNAVTLAAGRNFVNGGVGAASNISTPSGRWLIYSTNPTDTLGEELLSPAAAFNRYNCTYASCGGGVTIPVAGNGLIYSFIPTLNVTGVTSTKTLDGNSTAPLLGGAIMGALAGDTGIMLDSSGVSGMFADSAVGTAKPITLTGAYALGGTNYGYQLIQPSGITGSITLPLSNGGGGSAPVSSTTAALPPLTPASLPVTPQTTPTPPSLLPAVSPVAALPTTPETAPILGGIAIPNTVQIVSQLGNVNELPIMPLRNVNSSPTGLSTHTTDPASTTEPGLSNNQQPAEQPQNTSPELTLKEEKPDQASFGSILHGLVKVHPIIQKRFGLSQTF